MAENNINFEEALASLEDIVSKLEDGKCSLDQSIELFEKGMKNIKDCKKALDNAEKKITVLTENEDA